METKEKIKKLIDDNDVCLFMKGTPDSPQCGFSMAVSNVLKHLKVNFNGINVLCSCLASSLTSIVRSTSFKVFFIRDDAPAAIIIILFILSRVLLD